MDNQPIREMKKLLDDHNDSIERILESAIVDSWADLMLPGQTGLIHVEYDVASNGNLDHLQVWSCIKRGYWILVCTYRMSASQSHPAGVQFDNDYESEGLAHALERVMQHQTVFAPPRTFGGRGSIRIEMPTAAESKAAAVSIRAALHHLDSPFAQLAPAGRAS
jgi:hypothetical protein